VSVAESGQITSSVARPEGRRRRVWLLAVGAVFGLVGVVWWLGTRVESPASRAAKAGPPVPSVVTAKVEKRVLAESVVTRGDVRPSGATTVVWTGGSSTGAALVTGVPLQPGGQVVEGQVVVEVSGRPVLAIAGTVPVYRDLRPGTSGKDVAQLQEALRRLGFAGAESDGIYGPGTEVAVSEWYQRSGFQAQLTSADATAQLTSAGVAVNAASDKLNQAKLALATAGRPKPRSVVLQADAALAAAENALEQAKLQAAQERKDAASATAKARAELATAQSTGGSEAIEAAKLSLAAAISGEARAAQAADASATAASDALDVARASHDETLAPADTSSERKAVEDATIGVTEAEKLYAALDAVTGPIVPASELVVLSRLPARVDTVAASVGAKADGALVSVSVDAYVVESTLSPAVKPLVQVGAIVKIDDEASGLTYSAKVRSVSEGLTTPKEGQGGGAGYLARIDTDSALDPKLLGANVRVTITGQSSAGEVLVVPAAAVFAQTDGNTRVTRFVNGVEEQVTVDTGLAAGGFVAISKSTPQLNAGDSVVVGR
jgi:peptidoglycan hydrolase-like protein with peptidoglycan-binding domain